jgi:hypothetical protein
MQYLLQIYAYTRQWMFFIINRILHILYDSFIFNEQLFFVNF